MRLEKAYLVILAFAVLLSLAMVASVVWISKAPHGTDFYYHLKFAEKYARGELALFDPQLMENNKGPYPPLFHLLLTPATALGFGVAFGAFLELLLYPLAVLATLYLVFKSRGLKTAAFAAVILLGGVAFFDRTAQVTPQAVDVILAPVAALAFFTNREKLFLLSIAAMVYSHAPYSFLLLIPFAAYAWLENKNKSFVAKAVALSTPAALAILYFLPGYLSGASAVNTLQEQLIMQNPLFFMAYVSPPLFLAFVIALYYGIFKKLPKGKREEKEEGFLLKAGELEKFCLLWIAGLLPLLFVFPDRFASYVSQPAAIYAGVVFAERINSPKRIIVALAVLLFLGVLYNQYQFFSLALEGRMTPAP